MSKLSRRRYKLNEGMRPGDLKYFIDNKFTLDQYKSKMGEDRNVVVMAFTATDKNPAIDLMEFIEKGFPFVLDADISTGEEETGHYSVFVELQRTKKVPQQIVKLLQGIGQLCDIDEWRFRYYKEIRSLEFSEDAVAEHVPLSPNEYDVQMLKLKNERISKFLNQGATDSVILDKNDVLTINKPYAESLVLKLIEFGTYEVLKESLTGAMDLSSSAVSQTLYLEKYLGNYEICKLRDVFLIKNQDYAMIVKPGDW